MAADPTLTPAQIAADAKNLFHNIKEALKRQKPWEQDVESQRQKLRRLHLSLLFSFPYAKESKDADTQLWMATSHSVITVYKALLASLDRERERSSGAKNHVVERRRLTQRFRQFLTEEDRFWTAFIVRYVRDFGLKDATISLSALEISDDTNDDNDPEASTKSNRRYQFPEPPSTPPETPNRRDQSLDIVYKALVCLGDIARYREQYSERAKPEQTRRGRNSKGPPPAPRVPNYGRAQDAYEQARLLVPENGNASHQLAILCNYQKDVFGATYHYYRAFCVKHPYETAAENMHITLHKALDSYMRREGRADEEHNVSLPSHVALERLKEKVVVLHASWRLPSEEANKKLPEFSLAVTTSFTSLISERILPVEVISRTLVMSFGALWKVKMLRDDHGKKEKETKRHYATEIHIAPHVLSLMTCLLRVGVLQLTDSTITSTANPSVPIDLAQNITAVFRRTLPALRISNKWVQANISYVASIAGKPNSNASLKEQVQDFWVAYQAFFTNLYRVFPVSKLPSLAAPLEEDVDMAGFLPLKHTMGELSTKSSSGLVPGQSQVHPNEEHLMRISDLIEDAISIAQNEKSPIMFDDGKFLFKQAAQHLSPKRPQSEIPPSKVAVKSDHGLMVPPSVAAKAIRQRVESRTVPALPTKDETEDDNVTVSTRTEDDPVNLAMNAVLDSDVSDTGTEEDEVVYPKQVTGTPSQPAYVLLTFKITCTHNF
ncbi:hypothetical protein SISSUDRAFT_316009 [Sistotremastrum suecicum HHB10207 ss-3]|uniref:Protein SMG7 n=1 Tax=Sistotremastrum suecicum HHB10207 ss-3 TaxID=1314776 RepID=A0A165ZA62_9AGAM|nr:hypothetical protein SISSUDRAFT_316009 [Sistotremastrum suecicum HHB10207 ss-3]